MTNTSRSQDALLAELNGIHVESVTQRAEIKRQIEAEFERRLEVFKIRKAELMAKGRDELGVAKAKLGRAIGTTDWKTIEEMLELGRSLRPESVIKGEKFSWGTVAKYFGPETFAAWVLVDGDEFESTIANITNPGYAVMATPGNGGTISYTVARGDDLTLPGRTREEYADLIAWIESYPPVVEA